MDSSIPTSHDTGPMPESGRVWCTWCAQNYIAKRAVFLNYGVVFYHDKGFPLTLCWWHFERGTP